MDVKTARRIAGDLVDAYHDGNNALVAWHVGGLLKGVGEENFRKLLPRLADRLLAGQTAADVKTGQPVAKAP